eukprot:g27388.t1
MAVVEEVLPRRSTLIRRQTMKPQVLCANLDLAVLVLSTEPNFSEGMVDRVLVSAHAQSLDVVLVLNKADLVPRGSEARHRVERRLFVYEKIGYKVLFVSALEGEGLEDLRSLLGGRTSILVGNSGVGKACLLNKLGQGQIEVTVGDISEKLKLGRHITTTTTMHRLPGEGPPAFLIDSPELKEHFIEFIPFARHCKFSDCRHLQEPGCMVKQAVEEGDVPPERYMSYQRIYQVLLEGTEGSFRSASDTKASDSSRAVMTMARRILKAGGCRVSRGGTEAQAAAATVAAAAAASASQAKSRHQQHNAGGRDPQWVQAGVAASTPSTDPSHSTTSAGKSILSMLKTAQGGSGAQLGAHGGFGQQGQAQAKLTASPVPTAGVDDQKDLWREALNARAPNSGYGNLQNPNAKYPVRYGDEDRYGRSSEEGAFLHEAWRACARMKLP